MALNNNFYIEILEKEKYWSELARLGLLNIYYLNGNNGLREFYQKKQDELEYEYNLTKSDILKNFLDIIKEILDRIDIITINYRNGIVVSEDLKCLVSYFLASKMNNNTNELKIQNKKNELEQLKKEYLNSNLSESLNIKKL